MNLSGWTSLHNASGYGHESVVRALIELGGDIHAKNKLYPYVIGGIMTLPSEVLGTLEHLFFELMEHRNTSKKIEQKLKSI